MDGVVTVAVGDGAVVVDVVPADDDGVLTAVGVVVELC